MIDKLQFCAIRCGAYGRQVEEIFRGKRPTPGGIKAQARMLMVGEDNIWGQRRVQRKEPILVQIKRGEKIILIDASWQASKMAGWGAAHYDQQGKLHKIVAKKMSAEDPFHTESLALLYTLQDTGTTPESETDTRVLIFSDNQALVKVVTTADMATLLSWKAEEAVARCIQQVRQKRDMVAVNYITRDALVIPHLLANNARRTGEAIEEQLDSTRCRQRKLAESVDLRFFAHSQAR